MSGKQESTGSFKYKSKLTGEYILAHQYIAELAVSRKAIKDKVQLPYKFWKELDVWKAEFKRQVQQAGKLLKKYDAIAIINAMNNLSWCYSLMSPQLLEAIKQEDQKLKSQTISTFEIDTNTMTFSVKRKGKGLLGKKNDDSKTD